MGALSWLRSEKEKFQALDAAKKASDGGKDATAKPDGYYARNNGYCSGTLASSLAGSSNMVWRC